MILAGVVVEKNTRNATGLIDSIDLLAKFLFRNYNFIYIAELKMYV